MRLFSHARPRPRPRPQSSSSQASSATVKRYRESTHLIPTPGVERIRPPRYLSWSLNPWIGLPIAAFMVVLGIAIEVTLSISRRNNGFTIPQQNVFSFAPPSFLTSFFPTLFVFPLSFVWIIIDRSLRRYQPYVALAQGNKRAEESVMADYVTSNFWLTLWRTFKRREWILHISMLTSLIVHFFQPLAGALLSVGKATIGVPTTLGGATTIGLVPDVGTLNAFLAAAGFTEAAAFQRLPDPPFVDKGWATASFTLPPNPGINASVAVNSTGIRTDANCVAPATLELVPSASDNSSINSFTITAAGADGCRAVAVSTGSRADQQYGTAGADPASCGLPADTPPQFAPVMFWFYRSADESGTGAAQAQAVLCRPEMRLFNVWSTVDLNNGSLTNVTITDAYTQPNNVTGPPLNGTLYNAVLFGDVPEDDFVEARATAIKAQIPGAIFRLASLNATALQEYFDAPEGRGFVDLTTQIYTQHLAVSAKTVYFVNESLSLPATKYAQEDRLFMDTLAAHSLALILMTVGLVGFTILSLHVRKRRALYLTVRPSTIAAIVALTSHSGFGERLYPYDDSTALRAKLAHLRFGLDRRTGAVVADEYGELGDADADGSGDEEAGWAAERQRQRETETEMDEMERQRSPGFPIDIPYEHEPLVVPESMV